MRAKGRPITGAEYQKLEGGPAPRRLKPVRDELLAQGDARLVEEVYLGRVQHRLVAGRRADTSMFEPEELEIVDQVLQDLRLHTGTTASILSHEDMGWTMVEDRETIPYESAFLRRPVLTDAVRKHAARLAAER